MFAHPGFYCIVAEQDGGLIGGNCMDERNVIAGIGPITIDPSLQNNSAGRQLMKAVLDRAESQKFAGVRLVQAGYHMRSLSLYAKLGFVVREPLACMFGAAPRQDTPGFQVRPAKMEDLRACNAVAFRVHGQDRGGELSDSIKSGSAIVVETRGRIAGYASSLSFFGHSVAESNGDMQALISAAQKSRRPESRFPCATPRFSAGASSAGCEPSSPSTL